MQGNIIMSTSINMEHINKRSNVQKVAIYILVDKIQANIK